MKLILFAMVLALAFTQNDNINKIGASGDTLKTDMQSEENEELVYIIQFMKVNSDDAALTASNENQKEGMMAKVNALDQLEDEQKAQFQTVEVNDDNAKLMKKWHVKDNAADKRSVFLVAKGGQGKTFTGPLATTKSLDYFKKIMVEVEEEEAEDEDDAGDEDGEDAGEDER